MFTSLLDIQVLAKKLNILENCYNFFNSCSNPFNYSKRSNIILEINEGKLVHNYGNFNYKYMYFLKNAFFLRIFI